MQKFVNLTDSQKEKAIKIGTNVPAGSIGLSWYTAKDILPVNNIVSIDLSETIQENRSPFLKSDNEAFFAFSDEIGLLRTIDGNYTFPSDDVKISNISLDKAYATEVQDYSSLNPNDFIHHYYISKFFIIAPYVFSFYSLTQYVDQDKYKDVNMKVVDQNGEEYVDQNTGRKKYRFVLEPFKTSVNRMRTEIPYRIIVLLDATTPPSDLKLIYDKVECDDNGNTFHLEINYSETINAVNLFDEVPEESFVLDNNYRDSKIYSIKKLNQKYSDIVIKQEVENGYQIISPSKALDDYRTFEVFNWRLIARTNNQVSLSELNGGQELSSDTATITKTIRVGVLYSSLAGETNSTINPYVFARLESSPFNLAGYEFVNPAKINPISGALNNASIDKTTAAYWKVDIDGDDLRNYDYDIVVWSPTSAVSLTQANKIREFTAKSGTVILDLSKGVSASKLNVNVSPSTVNSASATFVDSSPIIDKTKNGGWTIDSAIFEKPEYGINGSRKTTSGVYKNFPFFTNYASENSFIKFGPNANALQSVGLLIPYVPANAAELVRGNIVAVTFPLASYCNSIYSLSTSDQVVNQNAGLTIYSPSLTIGDDEVYPGILEGPFKFLYNCVSFAAYCRISATREKRINSSLFNFVTDWSSGWVMDQDALMDEEKVKYFKSIPDLDNLGLDIINKESINDFYKTKLDDFMLSIQQDKVFGINYSNIQYYIEVTNPDVKISNATAVSQASLTSDDNIPSTYNLYKVIDSAQKCFAYTTKSSPKLVIPDGIGPYSIIDKTISSSDKKTLANNLSILNSFKSYPFKLQSSYTYTSGSDKPVNVTANANVNFSMIFKGKYTRTSITYTSPTASTSTTTLVNTILPAENFASAIDDIGVYVSSSSQPLNTYLYSGDIDIHKDPRLWKVGMTHDYVKYIQYTVGIATGLKVSVDGVYGNQTANAVKTFQTNGGQRFLDATVDSETKSFMAFFWKKLKKSDINRYNALRAWAAGNPATAGVVKYIDATNSNGSVDEIGSKTYKKLTFSGFGGPNEAKDIIFFKIPNSIKSINKIIIEPSNDPVWKNYTIDIYGYSATDEKNIFKTTNFVTSKSAVNGNIEILLNGIDATKARYMWFQVNGKWLPGYGYAEGFSINSIKVDGKVAQTATTPGTPGSSVTTTITSDIWAKTTVSATQIFSGVNIATPQTKTYSPTNIPESTAYIQSLIIGCESNGVTTGGSPFPNGGMFVPTISSPYSLDASKYSGSTITKFYGDKVEFDFTKPPVSLTVTSATITSVSEAGKSMPTSVVDLDVSSPSIVAKTASVYYSSSGVHVSQPLDLSSGFYLRTVDGRLLPATTNTVDVNDGILLLCNSNGAPFGIPSSVDISSNINNLSSSLAQEIDWRYGNLSTKNLLGETTGFIYGFYDVNRKEFIGKTIPYLDIVSRGPSNIFIAVCAIDADGNTQNKNEYIGPRTSITFKPVNLPLKMIAPIYSVKVNKSSAIQMGSIDPNISKFDAWELPISNGSFWKSINISNNRSWSGWKANYIGQDMYGYYSTLDELNSFWSKIYGYGFYDIVDESPIIIDDRTIQLRRVPLMNMHVPTDNLNTKAGIIKQVLQIYTRPDIDSSWSQVAELNIRDINSQNGIIKFRTRLVPSARNLIKVSYVTACKDNLIKQINGVPVPLNPMLNSESIDFDQALYIYLLPKAIYKEDLLINTPEVPSVGRTRVRVKQYNKTSVLNFTYNSALFDERSSEYNPFALPIAIIYVTNNPYRQTPELSDIRLRGGGLVTDVPNAELKQSIPDVLSYWDVYPPSGEAYAKGGYIIIRIPEEVKSYFIDEKEIYQIISNNLTAGIAYELQDMNGNSWN